MDIKPSTMRSWSRLGQRGTFFAIAMPEIGAARDDVRLLTADVAILSSLDRFKTAHPDKFLNVGIAEQNMIGIAAGLAMEGRCVFATTYAAFIAVRSLEHIRQHLSHLHCNMKVVGMAAGVLVARSGVSHWAIEDLAFMRALPDITILSPADALEAYKMAHYAADHDGPMYIRLSGGPNAPMVYKEDYPFEVGKAVTLRSGTDVALLATGLMVSESLAAAESLQEKGISCTVLNVHTLRPLDEEALRRALASHRLLVTVEEHSVRGGLGGAVAEFKATLDNSPRQVFLGFRDFSAQAGGQRFVWEQNGLTAERIAERIERELG